MPPNDSLAPQGAAPRPPYNRRLLCSGGSSLEEALSNIIDSSKDVTEDVEEESQASLDVTELLEHTADFAIASGPVTPQQQDDIDSVAASILPPAATYDSYDDLETAARDWAKACGYDFTKRRSKMTADNRQKGQLGCDKKETEKEDEPVSNNKDGRVRNTRLEALGAS
jgi:hypothetical protein